MVKSPELLDALCAYLAQGGMMLTFAKRVGLGRSALSQWCSKDPKWKAAVAKAREQGVDALAEEALAMATDPLMVEDVYERYDNDGNLLSRDVKTGDAVYARKLAVSTRLDLLKKWAPEKYGDQGGGEDRQLSCLPHPCRQTARGGEVAHNARQSPTTTPRGTRSETVFPMKQGFSATNVVSAKIVN